VYNACYNFVWSNPSHLFNVLGFGNQARPFQFLILLPVFVSDNVKLYFLFQNGVVLIGTLYLINQTLLFFCRRTWVSAIGAFFVLCTPSFSGNYYVITTEPYMLFGMYGVVFVLVRLIGIPVVSRRAWWWYNGTGIVFAMYAIGVKEPGVMVFAVCVAAGVLLARLERLTWSEAWRRCWLLGLAAVIICGVVIAKYLSNATVYDAGGTGGYAFALPLLQQSLGRFVRHFVDTAPYALLAVPAWGFVALLYEAATDNEQERQTLRIALTGAAMLFVIAAGMAAIYVPWQIFDARYLLLSSSGAVAATVLTIYALSVALRMRISVLCQLVMMNLVALLSGLLTLHVAFTMVVGPLSRGLVTHKYACAYDDMFRFVAAQTPSNRTAYFMMDSDFAEPIENTRIGLRVFYDRPDIYCAFPQSPSAFAEAGLVAVTTIKDFSFNYPRMPVHSDASAKFSAWASNDLRFVLVTSFVYRTPVLYVRDEYNVPQYKAWWGIPAFWELKRGVYHFGWNVYRFAGSGAAREQTAALASCGEDLVRDGSFAQGWQCWNVQDTRTTQAVAIVAADAPGAGTALRMAYQRGPMLHVRQHIKLDANAVYRLSGVAKMIAPAYPEVLGARLAVFTPDRKEVGVAWDYVRPGEWERQQVVFTNAVKGGAVVYAEMGRGRGARAALVTEVRVERVTSIK